MAALSARASTVLRTRLPRPLPPFVDQPLAELLDLLLMETPETAGGVDVPGGGQLAVCPQGDLAVPGLARKLDAGLDEPPSEPASPGVGFDEQQAQLGDRRRFLHQAHGSHPVAIAFRNPAAFARQVEPFEEL